MSDDRTAGLADGGGPPADEASTRNLLNFARGAKGVALLCFLLPWVTVSCAGQPLVRMTGVGLATGDVDLVAGRGLFPGAGAENPAASFAQSAQPDPLVIVAAVLIVAGLALTFVKPLRTGILAAMAAAVAAAVLIAFDVLVRIKGGAEARLAEGMNKDGPAAAPGAGGFEREMQKSMEQIAEAITVDPQAGFWLTLLALIAAAVLLKVVHGRRRSAPPG
ncbi:MAG TPA: hypothetical protein VEZ20_13925 [Allosphingosinicella sp.]|nr:hypothetical protein [Allosphingosinicella sp.]